jgi:hypothetical protein
MGSRGMSSKEANVLKSANIKQWEELTLGDRPNQLPFFQSPSNNTSCTCNWTQTTVTQLASLPFYLTAPRGCYTLEVSQVTLVLTSIPILPDVHFF